VAELFDRYERALSERTPGRGGHVRIAGSGVVAGGKYEKISISGSGRVTGDVEAEEVRVSGSALFMGSISAKIFKCAGSCKVGGDVKSEVFKAAGSASIQGSIDCGEVRIAGSLRALSVKAKLFYASGSFGIEFIEADEVMLSISDVAKAGKIKAKTITVEGEELVKLSIGSILKIALRRRPIPVLEVEEITAESIVAEDVVIRGNVAAKEIVIRGKAHIAGNIQGEVKREK
jgi:cytoskeletal protein CcmA (bactofilin family)